MLALIDRIRIPNKHGIEKISPKEGEPKKFWSLSIINVIPTENKAENIKEYPIKWTDKDCWNIPIKNISEKINGRNTFCARNESLINKYNPKIDSIEIIAIPTIENIQL